MKVETNKKITLGTISSTNFAEITKLIVVIKLIFLDKNIYTIIQIHALLYTTILVPDITI
jgi:hypothetical protein